MRASCASNHSDKEREHGTNDGTVHLDDTGPVGDKWISTLFPETRLIESMTTFAETDIEFPKDFAP